MDRTVREVDRSFFQQIDALSRKVETLRARTLVGAALDAYVAEFLPPSVGRETVVEMTVPSGRWFVEVEATPFHVSHDPASAWNVSISTRHMDGSPWPEAIGIAPHAVFTPNYTPTVSGVGATHWTLCTLSAKGWVDADDQFVIALEVWVDGSAAVPYWLRNKLILTPR